MKEISAIICTETDLKILRRTTEDAIHDMRFAQKRADKTKEKSAVVRIAADKASVVAAKAQQVADEMKSAAARALRAEKELFDDRGGRKGRPFAQTWAARVVELGLTERIARDLLQLSGYKEESPDIVSGTSDDSSSESVTSEETDDSSDPDDSTPGDAHAVDPDPPVDRSGGRGKPEWLMRALVRDYSMPATLVCDPLAGWGSTLRAALNEGRRAIGAELDPDVAAAAGDLPIHVGPWQKSLAHVDIVDAIICDPPYSKRTHEASRKFGNAREDGSSLEGLGPEYSAWTREHVHEFVSAWAPRCRGWFVALTDHNLIPHWQDAYEAAGLYSFAPVGVLIKGMTVRLCGDGPSSELIYAMVARPKRFSRWDTLHGAYVGTRTRLEYGGGKEVVVA